jgi:DNA-binding PadR family transcriptional regulator
MGPGWGGGRRRLRRGDIRRSILSALQDGPAHGYEVMSRLETRSGGMWRPSPGSVYPTLQMLEDEGMVQARAEDGTRVYELTPAGEAEAAAGAAAGGRAPWEAGDGTDHPSRAFRDAMVQSVHAARQIMTTGSPSQVARATEILQRAKKELYQVLAED